MPKYVPITIATTGNASAFGNLSVSRRHLTGFGSFTRTFFAGGATPSMVNHIDYFVPTAQGNAADFGDLTNARKAIGASASTTRGVVFGGTNPSNVNIIDYITMASIGNAIDFGNLSAARTYPFGTSNSHGGII